MTEKEKMLAGMLYDPSDSELTKLLIKARKLARQYNQIDEDESEKRMAILRELLPNTPNLPGLQAPVYFDYGCNTYFGKLSPVRNIIFRIWPIGTANSPIPGCACAIILRKKTPPKAICGAFTCRAS